MLGISNTNIRSDDLRQRINSLKRVYMPIDLNPAFYKTKVIAIQKLDQILKCTTRKDLQDSDFTQVLICSLTLVYFFGMRLKLNMLTTGFWFCTRGKRDFRKAELVFQKTMDMLQPERSDITIKTTLKFFTDISLWPFEGFIEQILEVVLYFNRGKMTLFHIMLTDIHYVLFSDIKSARHRMRVFYELLKSDIWIVNKKKILPLITRLLGFFAKSENKVSVYIYLRKGFEVCLRRIFERADNQSRLTIITTMLSWFAMVQMTNDDVLEFSSLLYRVAELYKVGAYTESLNDSTMQHVLNNLLGSSNILYSLIGSRLLERFFDRQNNAQYLVTPMIFYEFSQMNLRIGNYESGDKAFIRHHREKIHVNVIKACKMHCSSSVNLKALFFVICSIVLEVPCGLTAAAAACIVMSIQDLALNEENISATCRNWMHAFVVSIMSLICWVHKSTVLYSYVNKIIARRAREAPQLNPPMLQIYNISHHHATWNKPTLFFEDWELRYGLWKHFSSKVRNLKLYCVCFDLTTEKTFLISKYFINFKI